jgi:hypothetical protein
MALDFMPTCFSDNLLFVRKIFSSYSLPINQTLSDGLGQASIRARRFRIISFCRAATLTR